MVILMVNLGFWQLRRLDDRRALNEATAAAMAQDPTDIATLLAGSQEEDEEEVADYTSVIATGTYLSESEVRVANRSSGGLPGSWLATPLRLGDGRVVAVVRGWISRRSLLSDGAVAAQPPAGEVTVAGLAFGSRDNGRVGVTDAGETPEISTMDLSRFSEVTSLDVEDIWIRLRSQAPPQPGPRALPVPVPVPELNDGPHLSYALQWFSFSIGTVIVYLLILRRVVGNVGRSQDRQSRFERPPDTPRSQDAEAKV